MNRERAHCNQALHPHPETILGKLSVQRVIAALREASISTNIIVHAEPTHSSQAAAGHPNTGFPINPAALAIAAAAKVCRVD